jgi:hypothetical protein
VDLLGSDNSIIIIVCYVAWQLTIVMSMSSLSGVIHSISVVLVCVVNIQGRIDKLLLSSLTLLLLPFSLS